MNAAPQRADYGIDAPAVIRNLFLAGGAGLLTWATASVGLWSGKVYGVPLALMGLCAGLPTTATGLGMLWYSKAGKLRMRERLLGLVPWRGDEAVLDVGCGRGLMLLGAAKRLTTGKATGIDIWQAEDLTGNHPEATLENARREGVEGRVEVRTADMRQMPFADASFDVVVSCAAVHNLYTATDRDQAVAEIARVLKPGGHAVIADIRHLNQYAAELTRRGCGEVRRVGSPLKTAFLALLTFGSLRPGTLLARKTSAS